MDPQNKVTHPEPPSLLDSPSPPSFSVAWMFLPVIEGEEEEVRKWELSEGDRTYSSDSGEFFFVNFLLVLQIL